MTKIKLLMLTPLLRMAVDRYGKETAKLVESSTSLAVVYEACEHARTAIPHICNATHEEEVFAAELLEEAAMMLLCAARKLRDEAVR